jgi:lysophospholipase L1-like esterase
MTSGHAQSGNVNTQNAARLVILGASYAGSWKQPDLPGYQVVNKGVSGEETNQVLARMDRDVVALKPSAVLLWGHINNIHRAPGGDYAGAKARAKADYQAMVARARENGIKVILATEVTLPEAMGIVNQLAAFVGRLRGKTGYSALINGHVREVNAWMRSYAAQERIPVLDFEKVFDDGDGFRKVEYTTDDGSHISAAGYAELTRYARDQLRASR